MKKSFPHQFIAIEGNIGAGKTTLCNMMEKDFGAKLILEQFTDNPFLPYFYKNPERYAFQVELFFMTERHKQLQEYLSQRSLFQEFTISDYFFIKTLLFAKNNLVDEEYRLFNSLFNVLNTTFRKPDLLVYLHRPVEDLMRNIENRGREYEKDIKPEYLLSLQNAYFDYFRTVTDIPVLIIDVEGSNFWTKKKQYKQIVKLIQSEDYTLGVQRRKIRLKEEVI
ncbi:MAG: deoxyguanosine kinase [Saprospiraceae bacterium]|jgi:deoxyguanosine kinase